MPIVIYLAIRRARLRIHSLQNSKAQILSTLLNAYNELKPGHHHIQRWHILNPTSITLILFVAHLLHEGHSLLAALLSSKWTSRIFCSVFFFSTFYYNIEHYLAVFSTVLEELCLTSNFIAQKAVTEAHILPLRTCPVKTNFPWSFPPLEWQCINPSLWEVFPATWYWVLYGGRGRGRECWWNISSY